MKNTTTITIDDVEATVFTHIKYGKKFTKGKISLTIRGQEFKRSFKLPVGMDALESLTVSTKTLACIKDATNYLKIVSIEYLDIPGSPALVCAVKLDDDELLIGSSEAETFLEFNNKYEKMKERAFSAAIEQ